MRRNGDTVLRACERRFEETGDPTDLDALLREVERHGSVEYVSDSLFRFTYEWGMRIDELAWQAFARQHGLAVEPKVSWPRPASFYPLNDPFWIVGKRGYDLAMAAWHARERSPAYAAELELKIPSMFELPRTLRRFRERLTVGDLERAELVRQAVLESLRDIRSFKPGPGNERHPLRDPETKRRLLQEAQETLALMDTELGTREKNIEGNPSRNAVLRLRGGESLRCPWCLDTLDPQGEDVFACPSCWAPQHASCAEEHGRCAVCRQPISAEAEEELEERREREAGYGRAIKRAPSGKLKKIPVPPEELERERLLEESQEELERYEDPREHHTSGRLPGAERRERVPTPPSPKQKLPPRKRGRRPYPRYVEEVRKGRRYRIPVCVTCGADSRLERVGSRILRCPKCQTVHVDPEN